jgi:hypothetical protein
MLRSYSRSVLKCLCCLFLDDFLQREPAPVEFGFDSGEAGQGGLAQPVALDLAGDGCGRLFYGRDSALQC